MVNMIRRQVIAGLLAAPVVGNGAGPALASVRFTPGLNIVQTPSAPFGSAQAADSLAGVHALGARACAIIPFFWQSGPADPNITMGSDMSLEQLALGIRQAKAAGLQVTVKPHVWVPGGWAGVVRMNSEAAWGAWFANYRKGLARYCAVAAAELAAVFCVGVELQQTLRRPEWAEVIADCRRTFHGRLTFAAHGSDGAEATPFWDRLDAVGVTLYPPMGADNAKGSWRKVMTADADRMDRLAARFRKPVQVLELGIRSAQGAAAKPWESAEERSALPSQALQADVLDMWMQILARPSVEEVLVWRWFSDPKAGGPADTDFTIQGKLAERRLKQRWGE
jgi:hypothetical protein